MENYEIQYQIGFRNDCKTYMVQQVTTKEQFILKMIECKDETHANEVFRESNNIRKIQHPYIVTLIESFVHFDSKAITFFLIVVMPFYRNGNCYQILRNNWMRSKKTDEESLKKMLVQVLELLSIMDECNISHMNLKPENIFYSSQNEHVILCDFGYKSIINDKRRFIRSKPDDFLWTSPLISVSKDHSKIDIWTIGMILFSFMTTSVINESKFFQILQSTEKYNLTKLESYMRKLYSKDFVDFTLLMLESDNDKRPGIKEIISTDFYQQCFKVYSSQVISRQNRQRITPNIRPIPTTGRPNDILNYIWTEKQNELCVEEGLSIFQKMCTHNIINQLSPEYGKLLTESMDINNVNSTICEYVCSSLGYLAMYSNNFEDYIFTRPVIQSVVNALQLHPENCKLFRYAAAYFVVLSSFSSSSILIGKMKGLEILINALFRFKDKVNVAAIILNAIWNLCVEQENCEIAIKNNTREAIIEIYEEHTQSPEVLLNASACLLAIITSLDVSINSDNINLVHYLLKTLIDHSGFVNLVKYTLILLENLIAMNEEHAMQFIDCQPMKPETDEVYRGFEILSNVYKIHEDNSIIILSICNLILRVVSYEDLVDVMIDLEKLSSFLNIILFRYKHSRHLLSCINLIKTKIEVQLKYLDLLK